MSDDPTSAALTRATAGQYSIQREVGRGGMGVVYLATDEQLQRPVAIKTLPPHLAADARVRDRFLREARTAGALSHPNIVPIYSAAERDGVVYFAMRYINGESLAERIARNGFLQPAEVVSLLRQLASALSYAHANGVVHRDIKAENVLFDNETGRAMLTDFGIARLAETQSLTATGTVLGTVQYMSPEQVSGDELDGRSDLYSLGILAFFALSGRFPFERPTPSAIVVAHVTATPPKVCSVANGVPLELGEIVDRLLSKSPDGRYADGLALRSALDTISFGNSPSNTESSNTVSSSRSPLPSVPAVHGFPNVAVSKNSFASQQLLDSDVLSSADAQEIWARAAELQANTGMIVPPAEFRLAKNSTASETTGFHTSLVRDSAVDAGIDARYIDRALAERTEIAARSIAPRPLSLSPVTITLGEAMKKKPNTFLGGRTKIEMETSFDGELSELGFEDVADEIRRALGDMVNVSGVGRTLTVTSTASDGGGGRNNRMRRMQIHLTSRKGKTTVRAFEDLSQVAAAMFMGLGFGGSGIVGTMSLGIIMSTTQNGRLAGLVFGGIVISAVSVARLLFARTARKREKELHDVLQRVVARARESLDADEALKLPSR